MPTATVNGLSVYYRDEGAGQGVVMLHSSSGTGGQWRPLSESLAERYRVISPDLLGYGKTDQVPVDRGTTDFEESMPIVSELIDRAGPPVHLVGHSYGGYLAIAAALRRPGDVSSLSVFEPTLFFILADAGEQAAYDEIYEIADRTVELTRAGRPEAAARVFLDYWVAPGALDAMPEKVRKAVVSSMQKLRHEWPRPEWQGLPTIEAIGELPMPVHIMSADGTTLAARKVVQLLRGALPDADYTEISGAGHMAPVTHPEKVNPAITAFLDRNAN